MDAPDVVAEAVESGRLSAQALTGVPLPLLRRLAAARDRVPVELRCLLLAVLAEPDDPGGLGALRDWIEGRQARPDRPETFSANGVAHRVNDPKPWEWWAGAKHLGTLILPFALVEHMADKHGDCFSLADVLAMTPDEIGRAPGIGRCRLAVVVRKLHSQGLLFRGETPSVFDAKG